MAELRDELQLVLLAQCDDHEALEALFIRLQDRWWRYISSLVGDTAAEDVLQDVFIRIWRNLKWLHRPELFRPWAYRIATRACFEHLRYERRWSEREGDEAMVRDLPAPVDSELTNYFPEMEILLSRVSPASRAALLLHYGQDLSIEEAAAVLEISIGTAKSRLSYGLSCLRKWKKKE
jgi:RNA polymerase sigma-70 factor (ECF subfamily)